MRAKSGFGHGMSDIAMTPEVFLEPKATAATHMGALEGSAVFFFACSLRSPQLAEHCPYKSGHVLEEMPFGKQRRTLIALVRIGRVKKGRGWGRAKIKKWAIVGFLVRCGTP